MPDPPTVVIWLHVRLEIFQHSSSLPPPPSPPTHHQPSPMRSVMIMATVNGPEDNSKLLSVSINPSPTRVRVHTAGGYRDQHMASDGRSSEYLAAAAAVHANLLASFDVHMLCGSSQTRTRACALGSGGARLVVWVCPQNALYLDCQHRCCRSRTAFTQPVRQLKSSLKAGK